MELGMKGKTGLVTGASEGIGMAIARTLADEGARVAICARTEAKLKEISRRTGMDAGRIPAGLGSLSGCENVVVDGSKSRVI